MKHLSKDWKKIKEKMKGAYIYLFLDFDGTLTPIENYPENVKLSKSVVKILQKLKEKKTVIVSIISGRELKDIKALVGIKGIIYAGNHGFEIEGPRVKYAVPVATEAKKIIKKLTRKLKGTLQLFEGVIVEDKKFTISVHYRMAKKDQIKQIKRIFEEITEPFRTRREIRVTSGKKVWEVRPPIKWDKGKTVLSLLGKKELRARTNITPIYIGDDTTDEDAFLALRDKGYTVKISETGRKKSYAKYYLKNAKEVEETLNDLTDFVN